MDDEATTRTGTWIAIDTGILDHEVWEDQLAFRLWSWLLIQAKKNRKRPGTVRFSYAKAADGVAWMEGRKRVTPTRFQLRRCLSFIDRTTSARIPDAAQRSAQGKAQGYFVVEVGKWGVYQFNPGDGAQGKAQDAARVAPDKRPSGARVTVPLDDRDKDRDNNNRDDGSVFDQLGTLDADNGLDEIGRVYERVTARPPGNWCPAPAAEWAPLKMRDLFKRRGASVVCGEYEEWLRDGNLATHIKAFFDSQGEKSAPPAPSWIEEEKKRQAAAK